MDRKATDFNSATGILALWGGWGLAILAWILHLSVSYVVVGWYCQGEQELSPRLITVGLNLLTLLTALLAGAGSVLAHRNLRAARKGVGPRERSRFMARSGYLMSLFFFAVILVQGLPNLFLGPCQ